MKKQPEQPVPPVVNPATMPLLDLLARCGALRYPVEQVIALLRPRYPAGELGRITGALGKPGTEEYNAYESGRVAADFQLQSRLLDQAGDSKESYDAHATEQRRRAINAALSEKFGLGDGSDT
jgi:hypothetical protein